MTIIKNYKYQINSTKINHLNNILDADIFLIFAARRNEVKYELK